MLVEMWLGVSNNVLSNKIKCLSLKRQLKCNRGSIRKKKKKKKISQQLRWGKRELSVEY